MLFLALFSAAALQAPPIATPIATPIAMPTASVPAVVAQRIAPVTVPPLAPPPRILAVCLYDDPKRIVRNPDQATDRAEQTMLNSLAGLLLRRGDPTGLYLEGNADARLVLQDLAKRRGVAVEYAPTNATAFGHNQTRTLKYCDNSGCDQRRVPSFRTAAADGRGWSNSSGCASHRP